MDINFFGTCAISILTKCWSIFLNQIKIDQYKIVGGKKSIYIYVYSGFFFLQNSKSGNFGPIKKSHIDSKTNIPQSRYQKQFILKKGPRGGGEGGVVVSERYFYNFLREKTSNIMDKIVTI